MSIHSTADRRSCTTGHNRTKFRAWRQKCDEFRSLFVESPVKTKLDKFITTG